MNNEDLPVDKVQWEQAIRRYQLETTTIHHGQFRFSGSKIPHEQFLLLRVLWLTGKKAKVLPPAWPAQEYYKQAKEFLTTEMGTTTWERYLKSIKDQTTRMKDGLDDLGAFASARQYQVAINDLDKESMSNPPFRLKSGIQTRAQEERQQRQEAETWGIDNATQMMKDVALADRMRPRTPVTPSPQPRFGLEYDEAETPSPVPSTSKSIYVASPHNPATTADVAYMEEDKDEEIINTALIAFLDALTIHCGAVRGEWSPHRYPFSFCNGLYTSMVDGYLKQYMGERICAIIEVKAGIRYGQNHLKIKRQEASEMAAWISEFPPPNVEAHRKKNTTMTRLLISQDRHEIYLNFGEFSAEYVDFVRGKDIGNAEPFLRIEEHGPFMIYSESGIRSLSLKILGFALMECKY